MFIAQLTVVAFGTVDTLLVARHAAETGSRLAARLLNDWASERGSFWHAVPKEYAKYLPQPMEDVALAAE